MKHNAKINGLFFGLVINLFSIIQVMGQVDNHLQTLNDSIPDTLNKQVNIDYGLVNKNGLTGSTVVVDTSQFNKGFIISPQELIMGKAAGLLISSNSGMPGSDYTMNIQGMNSLNNNGDPLIIVDGMILNNDLSFLNPNDIESFTVLKDISALCVYGEKAANGAIIITTKKGSKRLKVSYTGTFGVSYLPQEIGVFSGDELRSLINQRYANDPSILNILGTANTNWQKEIYQTVFGQDHYVGISGSMKKIPYRVSFGGSDQNGILKNTGINKITGTLSLDPSFLNNDLKVSLNVKGTVNNNNFSNTGAIASAIAMDPTQPVKDGNANSDGYFQWGNHGASLGTPNPVEELLANDNKSTVKRYVASVLLNYTFPLFPSLHANIHLATDNAATNGHDNYPSSAPSTLTNMLYGSLDNYHTTNITNLSEFFLNYQKDLSLIYSKIEAVAGYSKQHFTLQNSDYKRGIVDAMHGYEMSDSLSSSTGNYLSSFFGRLNYTLLNRYLLSFTIRQDADSWLNTTNNHAYSPACSFAWNIKDESFLKNVNALSALKMRFSYGTIKSSPLGTLGAMSNVIIDPNLNWTKTTSHNFGFDFGFFRNRITGSFNIYKSVSDDLGLYVGVPNGMNFSNLIFTNAGSMENMGYDFSLNFIPVVTKDVSLTVNFNLSYNQNKITKLSDSDPNYFITTGGNINTGSLQVIKVGYPVNSFFMNKQVYDANGNPIEGEYVNISGQGGTVSGNLADEYVDHSPAPDYLMGLSARLTYKKVDISASARTSLGNYVYNYVAAEASYDQLYQLGYFHNQSKALNDTKFEQRQFSSDYFVQDASFFKLDYVSAGYRFDNIFSKISAHVAVTVQNVLTLTKYKGQDPEVVGGIDYPNYPRPRIISMALTIDF